MSGFFFASTGVIIRDKVGNVGQFDDRTLFGNESNLHSKIAFTDPAGNSAGFISPRPQCSIEGLGETKLTVARGVSH